MSHYLSSVGKAALGAAKFLQKNGTKILQAISVVLVAVEFAADKIQGLLDKEEGEPP